MRAIFVNYSHPETPHVSAVRVPRFGEAMARRGHQIVLITKTFGDNDSPKPPEQVAKELRQHDWTVPYHIACKPVHDPWLHRVRNNHLPMPLRKAVVAWYLLKREGVFSDWVEGSKPYWDILVEVFRPEVIWGSFGHVDVLSLARNLALRAGVQWVMDIKDTWEEFIPKPLRRILARRFTGAAALTVNSLFQAERSAPWFGKNAQVVYSGGPLDLIADDSPTEKRNGFQITLVGSTYGIRRLEPFIEALQEWLTRRLSNERLSITFAYAGGDSEIVKKLFQKADLCHVEVYGYLPIIRMMKLCRASAVNCYLWLPSGFHHKLIELLCCRRPVIAYPGECFEAVELAQRIGGELHVCGDGTSISDTLEKLWECRLDGRNPGDLKALQEFTWDSQATTLDQTLSQVITGVG